jgi:ferredoxin-NADP reductase
METRGWNSGTRVTDRVRPTAWQRATVVAIREETPRVKTIGLAVDHWPGHLPGQHVDVRLTAADGYRAERSYSIASPPEVAGLELTVDRLDDGEVSPFLTTELRAGDTIDLRGPIGGYFVWSASASARPRPLLLVGGGSGVVPLMCMLRHRRLSGSVTPTALLYSVRTRADVIYHAELSALAHDDPRFSLRITLTRDAAPGWGGTIGRIGVSAVESALQALGGEVDSYVCGGDAFVEAASALLVEAGQPPDAIRTERFGAVSST